MKRRDFLRLVGVGGAVLTTAGGSSLLLHSCDDNVSVNGMGPDLDPRNPEGFVNRLFVPGDEGLLGYLEPDSPFDITAREVSTTLLPNKETTSWLYEVNHGGKTYLNPIIRINKGQELNVTLMNQLSEETIIHWHGLHVPHVSDGHPINAIRPGEVYQYSFSVPNRAATYFYHPHPDRLVGKQVYFGLGSLFIVDDEDEINLRDSLDLDFGETDIPLIIQDRNFDDDGNLVFDINPMIQTIGALGDTILVNRTVKPFFDAGTRIYRFRVLNESNSRTYKLAFMKESEKLPFYVIGNDGGLLDKPYHAEEVFVGVAERVDILLDLTDFQVGDEIYLKSLFFDPMDPMVGDMEFNQVSTLMNGEEFYVLKINVSNATNYDRQIPQHLSDIVPIDTGGADDRFISLPNPIEGVWFINNSRYNPGEVPISVNRNTVEVWRINNAPLAMPHPIHIHAFQFQVLERMNSPQQVSELAIDNKGRLPTDLGWKDTVLIWPGETVTYAIDFSLDFPGEQLYLFHCHNLEHEDQGMMINYSII